MQIKCKSGRTFEVDYAHKFMTLDTWAHIDGLGLFDFVVDVPYGWIALTGERSNNGSFISNFYRYNTYHENNKPQPSIEELEEIKTMLPKFKMILPIKILLCSLIVLFTFQCAYFYMYCPYIFLINAIIATPLLYFVYKI